MFLLAYMEKGNRIVIDAQMIEYHLGIGATNVNKYIKKLEQKKIIYRRNLGYKKGIDIEILMHEQRENPLTNHDIISSHMTFKNKNNYDNVSSHKKLMTKNGIPYIKQRNFVSNEIDYINPETGEIFHSSKEGK